MMRPPPPSTSAEVPGLTNEMLKTGSRSRIYYLAKAVLVDSRRKVMAVMRVAVGGVVGGTVFLAKGALGLAPGAAMTYYGFDTFGYQNGPAYLILVGGGFISSGAIYLLFNDQFWEEQKDWWADKADAYTHRIKLMADKLEKGDD